MVDQSLEIIEFLRTALRTPSRTCEWLSGIIWRESQRCLGNLCGHVETRYSFWMQAQALPDNNFNAIWDRWPAFKTLMCIISGAEILSLIHI